MLALLPAVLIAVSQLNHPTVAPGNAATTVVFAVDVTNTGTAPFHLTKLGFATWPTECRQYAVNRAIAPGATARIPLLRQMGLFSFSTTRVDATVDVTFATPAGERVESRTIPMRLRIDQAVSVR